MTAFRALCEEAERTQDASLDGVLPGLLARAAALSAAERFAEVARWSGSTRPAIFAEGGPAAGWLWDLVDGQANPRLRLLASARINASVVQAEAIGWTRDVTPLVGLTALGRHLDPTFVFEPITSTESNDERPDRQSTTRVVGDGKRGFSDRDYSLEHAGDSSYGNEYDLIGLVGASLSLESVWRQSRYTHTLRVSGPTPAVLDVTLAWSELLRHGPQILGTRLERR